jgi:3-hydroxyacyl-CoA dehydrogenase
VSDAAPERILVVGAGEEAAAIRAALARDDRPTDLLAAPDALPAGLATEAALIVEATPDADPAAKAAAVRTLLDVSRGRVPIAIATRLHLVESLLPASRHGARVVGLHLAGDRERGRPVVAEVAMPARFDDEVVDGVLALLEDRGLVALPCGDAPGRIIDRLAAVGWLEARSAATAGAPPDVVSGAFTDAGLSPAILGAEPRAADIVGAIHAGLGEPDRFDATVVRPRSAMPHDRAALADRLVLAVIAEAYRLVEEAVAGAEEIERAMTAGAGWTAGPFTLAGRRGLRGVVTALTAIARDPAEDMAARDRFAMPRVLWTMATV